MAIRNKVLYLWLWCAVWPLAAQKPARVSGRVEREDTGGGLEKAVVALYPQDEGAAEGRRLVETTADGAFAFLDVAPGNYAVDVSRNGFVAGTGLSATTVAVKPGGAITDLRLKLAPAGVISGTVVDGDGEPVQGLPVRIQRVQYLPGAKRQLFEGTRATTDDQGRFRLYGLNRGLYYLRTGGRVETSREQLALKQGPDHGVQYGDTWYPENALTEYGEPLRVIGGSEIGDVRIEVKREPVWSISGRIEGQPVPGVTSPTELECRRTLPIRLMYGSTEAIAADGTFKIDGLEAGDYILSARAIEGGRMVLQGYAAARVVDQNVRTVITLGAAGQVRGKVTGEGLEALGVEVHLESNEMPIYLSKVDAGGGFAIRDVPPGTYRFALRGNRDYIREAACAGSDYSIKPLTVSIGGILSDCVLKLAQDMGGVRGRVMEGDTPQPDVDVVAVPRDLELRRAARYAAKGKTGQDGGFVLRGMIPGDYWLFARSQDWTSEVWELHFPERHAGEGVRVEVQSGKVEEVAGGVLGRF